MADKTQFGSPDLKIEVADKTGVMQDLSKHVLENVEIDIEGLTEEGHGHGEAWVKQLFTGMKKGNEFTLGGIYDITAGTGPDAVLNDVGDTRKVKITWGGTKYVELMAVIKGYKRTAVRNELHKFSAPMLPTGEISEDAPLI